MATITQPPQPAAPDLLAIRGQLDALDTALHDLLMQRAGLVEQIAALGVKGPTALRPGREASILRRLLARHAGRFPAASLVMVWRELISGMTSMQGPSVLAVCDADPSGAFAAIAREHFGALTPMRVYRTAAQAVRDVSARTAAAAVLPLPHDDEQASAAWWTALLHKDEPRIHVTAKLPFWSPRPEGAAKAQAFVVSAAPPDPSGQDRSLIGLEVAMDQSRTRLSQSFAAAGFDAGRTVLRRDAGSGAARVLVDVAGFVADADPRLAALTATLRPPVILGAYAVPLEGAA